MNLGTYRGVRVKVNYFFLILIIILVLLERLPETLMLFGIVIVHELSHVIVARRLGLRVVEVELIPFGGVARVKNPLELNPAVERAVAIAGPLANLILLGAGLVFLSYNVMSPSWVRA